MSEAEREAYEAGVQISEAIRTIARAVATVQWGMIESGAFVPPAKDMRVKGYKAPLAAQDIIGFVVENLEYAPLEMREVWYECETEGWEYHDGEYRHQVWPITKHTQQAETEKYLRSVLHNAFPILNW